MSSPDGRTLEAVVREALMRPTDADVAEWVAKFEPYREGIEIAIDDWYADEPCSWRDFRNTLWQTYEDLVSAGNHP